MNVVFLVIYVFQSTLPRGERLLTSAKRYRIFVFQSTLPRGERPYNMALPVHTADFNPRSHEGSDNIVDNVDRAVNISIHAPTRGATISVQIVILQFKISIHAPTRGATTHADPPTACHDFNPRSHEGSDLAATCYSPPLRLFQSTLPRGERLCNVAYCNRLEVFQSTLPRGERRLIA